MKSPAGDAARSHGGQVHAAARRLGCDVGEILDLSASLNPFAPSIDPAWFDRALRHYPDPTVAANAMAGAMDVDPARLVLTNGASEAIALVARLEPVGDVVDPEFSLYRRHLASVETGAPRWRSNPSNPIGRLADSGDIAAVWDESFYPLATGEWTRGDDGWRIGSLTKLWACPGLRLGFVIAPDDRAAAAIRTIQPVWSVNSLALAVVEPLLGRTDLTGWHDSIRSACDDLFGVLEFHGLRARDTDANGLLVDDVAPTLVGDLARHRILVRDCASFGMPGTVRIAVPDVDGLARLDWALRALDVGGMST